MIKNSFHVPVLLNEVVNAVLTTPSVIKSKKDNSKIRLIDGCFGFGSHSKAILSNESIKNMTIYGCDEDIDVFTSGPVKELIRDYGEKRNGSKETEEERNRLILKHGNISNMKEIFGLEDNTVDNIFFDLGVSSFQLDNEEKGFSFRTEGPLDMRMNQYSDNTMSAYEVVNYSSIEKLRDIIYHYGEESLNKSLKISKMIHDFKSKTPINTTSQLADLIHLANPQRYKKNSRFTDSATKTFQAIRMYVNDELYNLEQALDQSVDLLKPGGRLIVLTFHSLEDRLVKEYKKYFEKKKMKRLSWFNLLSSIHSQNRDVSSLIQIPISDYKYKNERLSSPLLSMTPKRIIRPSKEEIKSNPRSSSAKLRVIEKL
eukprot:TRINITY_DN4166_c0_g1_i1.p1 TRINITY_DN4166_c0_g1~~TRINITY_DN4166_c0_g1_i1.p1  ORF type:complete len:371 (-),score=80.59 TRINITY_DN4166_c0_g1_i1:118-1230(-)